MSGSMFPADHSGLAGILFGLVGLVLFGVTITLVMDGQLMIGSSASDADAASAGNDAKIAGLVKQLHLLDEERQEREGWISGLATLETAKTELAALQTMIGSLKEEVARERMLVEATTEAFVRCRTNYRNQLWARAVGKRMDELHLPRGKTYEGVTIKSVSAIELKIAHSSGSATIPVKDLPAELMETYLLSPGEARRITNAQRKREQEVAATKTDTAEAARRPTRPPTHSRTTSPAQTKEAEDAAEERVKNEADIRALRAEVIRLHRQISMLSNQISEARMKSAYGKHRSPPGSLETWTQRLSKLTAQDGQLRARLSMQEANLRRLDPTYQPPMPSRTR